MTTITKERIELFIKNPLENGLTRAEQMELARITLASLEAEPIGAFHIADQQVGGTSDYIKDGEWPIDNGVIDVYSAPPVQETGVYKDMLNIIVLLENNEWAEHCTSTVLGSLLESEITRLVGKEQPAQVVPEEIEPDSNNTYDYVDGWNACRAAMLQGAEPVSQTYELPQTQFEQVADLYEMQFDDGRTCAFHTDGAKAAQWLLACDGNKVQEYVRIERYQEAVIGNSPVIPDGWISCSERMPQIGETVALIGPDVAEPVTGYLTDYGEFVWALEKHSHSIFVSHWMPFPAVPRQEGNNG